MQVEVNGRKQGTNPRVHSGHDLRSWQESVTSICEGQAGSRDRTTLRTEETARDYISGLSSWGPGVGMRINGPVMAPNASAVFFGRTCARTAMNG